MSPTEWMIEKKKRDQSLTGCPPSLWLIHGKLYDLTAFVDKHPGGASWLAYTQGTDCTGIGHAFPF